MKTIERTIVVAARAKEPADTREEEAAEPGILTVSAPKLALQAVTKFEVLKRGWIFSFSAPQM